MGAGGAAWPADDEGRGEAAMTLVTGETTGTMATLGRVIGANIGPAAGACAVIGAQYGSEGKGNIVAKMAGEYDVHVRVGGPNAGHSFWHRGRLYKMQQIPCGWINRNARVVIGRGGMVAPEVLMRELNEIEDVDSTIWSRLAIDARTPVLDPELHYEGHVDGELHRRIGSTGEGVGALRAARIGRDPEHMYTVADLVDREPGRYGALRRVIEDDTPVLLRRWNRQGRKVLLEGTQGAGLSMVHGPWPYVTSADTGTAQLCADAGFPPHHVTRVVLVVRSHPIRVAGNSGPLKNETTWEDLSKRLGVDVLERTTVTKKVRRVGEWDGALLRAAVTREAPTDLALTFADYIDPKCAGATAWSELTPPVLEFIKALESEYAVPVTMVGTGGPTWNVVYRER
jgi:adenylosuccinate synthase